jgi:hypothetical protein
MIVVVASRYDAAATTVVARWGSRRATMLSAEDLCRPGWTLQLPDDDGGTSVIDGAVVSNADFGGVLTLRPAVFPQELRSIRRADRTYVSCELNAFLLTWLTAQSCRVVNRPTASSLAGPNWRPEQWSVAASSLGIPVRPVRRSVPAVPPQVFDGEFVEVTAIGQRCFGTEDSVLIAWTCQLAKTAGVDLLTARYSIRGGYFLGANPLPALDDPAIFEAVRSYVEGS